MADLDTGAARIGHGTVVHAVKPPIGQGVVCDPVVPLDRLIKTEDPIDCKVCLSSMNKDQNPVC